MVPLPQKLRCWLDISGYEYNEGKIMFLNLIINTIYASKHTHR